MALSDVVISDSTALISLLNIERFELLFDFSIKLIISQAVYNEVSYQPHAKKALDSYIANKQVIIKAVENNESLKQLLIRLDLGESESILLAKKENLALIIDEKKGRSVATELGVKTIGLLGILLLFKKKKILSDNEIIKIVNELQAVEFRVSDTLLAFLLD